jgi:hypothetical protein
MPEGVQRRRTAGWRMPPNTKSVTRPGPWANPYKVGAVRIWRIQSDGTEYDGPMRAEDAVLLFEWHLARNPELVARARLALAGNNLACYCPKGSPCHRDVWGRLLNKDWTP